jgi:hypothetical protein
LIEAWIGAALGRSIALDIVLIMALLVNRRKAFLNRPHRSLIDYSRNVHSRNCARSFGGKPRMPPTIRRIAEGKISPFGGCFAVRSE